MRIRINLAAAGTSTAVALLALLTGGAHGSPAAAPPAPPWAGFAANAQHTAVAPASPQPLNSIHWQVTIDHQPPTSPPDGPFAHYASPMITSGNTVVVPIRLGPRRGFELSAYAGDD